MDISPLLTAPLTVQLHVIAALSSLALTPVMLLRRRGDAVHKMIGRFWVLAMALTAMSSFAIHDIRLMGPFSPIHILSAFTLYTLAAAILSARAGKITAHKQNMVGAMGGLLGAGLFTLLPGRLMSEVFFKGIETEGFVATLVLSVAAILLWRLSIRRNSSSAV